MLIELDGSLGFPLVARLLALALAGEDACLLACCTSNIVIAYM